MASESTDGIKKEHKANRHQRQIGVPASTAGDRNPHPGNLGASISEVVYRPAPCVHKYLHLTSAALASAAGMLHSLDEQIRLEVAVEARGSQQEALHVLHVESEMSMLLGREQLT